MDVLIDVLNRLLLKGASEKHLSDLTNQRREQCMIYCFRNLDKSESYDSFDAIKYACNEKIEFTQAQKSIAKKVDGR